MPWSCPGVGPDLEELKEEVQWELGESCAVPVPLGAQLVSRLTAAWALTIRA